MHSRVFKYGGGGGFVENLACNPSCKRRPNAWSARRLPQARRPIGGGAPFGGCRVIGNALERTKLIVEARRVRPMGGVGDFHRTGGEGKKKKGASAPVRRAEAKVIVD